MFREVELLRHVVLTCLPPNLDRNGNFKRHIVTRLLNNLLSEKGCRDLGHYISVTKIKSIGKAKVLSNSGKRIFPVVFNCRTFIPCAGEILEGVVHRVNRIGVFIKCGPVKYVYLSATMMPGYRLVEEGNPFFINDELTKIAIGVVVRFRVLAVRWKEGGGLAGRLRKEYEMLASLKGRSLGPISLCD